MWSFLVELVAPLCVCAAIVILLVKTVEKFSTSTEEQNLEKSIWGLLNGYEFSLPEKEKKAYYEIKSKSEDKQEIHKAMMQWAIACIPKIRKTQEEGQGIRRLYSGYMLHDNIYQGYLHADAAMNREIREVQLEAERFEPGFGQRIFPEANQIFNQLEQRKAGIERQESQKKMVMERLHAQALAVVQNQHSFQQALARMPPNERPAAVKQFQAQEQQRVASINKQLAAMTPEQREMATRNLQIQGQMEQQIREQIQEQMLAQMNPEDRERARAQIKAAKEAQEAAQKAAQEKRQAEIKAAAEAAAKEAEEVEAELAALRSGSKNVSEDVKQYEQLKEQSNSFNAVLSSPKDKATASAAASSSPAARAETD